MAIQIQLRRGDAATWTAANPIMASGEIGLETDTRKFKMGDGVTAWVSLPYAATGSIAGAWVNCAAYDASGGAFPTTGGTGGGGAVLNGNAFPVSVAGTLAGTFVPAGSTLLALIDAPGQVLANWRIFF